MRWGIVWRCFVNHQHPESTYRTMKVRWRGSEAVQFPLPAGMEHGWLTGHRGPTNQRLKSESVRIGQETHSLSRSREGATVSESLIPSVCLLTRSHRCTPGMKARASSPAWLRDQYHSFTARRMPTAWHFPEAWCSILIEQYFSAPPCVYPFGPGPSKLSPDATGTDDSS
jgi:hypothetical protein